MNNIKNTGLSGFLVSFLILSCFLFSARVDAGTPLQTKQFIQAGNKTLSGSINLFDYEHGLGSKSSVFSWAVAPSFGIFVRKGLLLEGQVRISGTHHLRLDKDGSRYDIHVSLGAGLKYYFDLSSSFLPFAGVELAYSINNLFREELPSLSSFLAPRIDALRYGINVGLLFPLATHLALELKLTASLSHQIGVSSAQPLFKTTGAVGVFWFF